MQSNTLTDTPKTGNKYDASISQNLYIQPGITTDCNASKPTLQDGAATTTDIRSSLLLWEVPVSSRLCHVKWYIPAISAPPIK